MSPSRRRSGALEQRVLAMLWQAAEPLSSSEIRASFEPAERPALTTILTVLARLEAKQLVVRTAGRGGARFTAAQTEAAAAAAAMSGALAEVSDRRAALVQFAGQLDRSDLDALRAALDS